jgi:hypothetical protein
MSDNWVTWRVRRGRRAGQWGFARDGWSVATFYAPLNADEAHAVVTALSGEKATMFPGAPRAEDGHE